MFVRLPNLFRYATSELSQDAFLCWLLAWADGRHARADADLYELGVGFVRALFEKAGAQLASGPISVDVKRQFEQVDLVALIGDGHVLVIEDKVHTRDHSDQLRRYRDAMETRYPGRELVCIYLKTGDQSSYATVRDTGWAVFTRPDLLAVLEPAAGRIDNAILADFLAYLQGLDAWTQRHRSVPVNEWNDCDGAYKGLYMDLQSSFPDSTWKYVPNKSGGFIGFTWGWNKVDGGHLYLQVEEKHLAIKVHCVSEGRDARRSIRRRWSSLVREMLGDQGFTRPKRFGSGKYMTVAVHQDYRIEGDGGLIQVENTRSLLQHFTEAVRELVQRESALQSSRDTGAA